jgi:hypothetical protein
MSGVSLPVTRPMGRALIVGAPASRAQPLNVLQRLGFQCAEVDDPYAAMLELCRHPTVYRALILSLNSLYREELQLIASVKHRFAHVEVWLTHIEARQAALAEAMRLGADGLLADDGLHRTAVGAPPDLHPAPALTATTASGTTAAAASFRSVEEFDNETASGEPVLSADELRALLQEQPVPPLESDEDR